MAYAANGVAKGRETHAKRSYLGAKRWPVGNVLAARRLYGFCVMRIGRAREFVPRYFKYFHVQIFA